MIDMPAHSGVTCHPRVPEVCTSITKTLDIFICNSDYDYESYYDSYLSSHY